MHPCVTTVSNKQSWLCQDVMCPSYEGPLHLSSCGPTDSHMSTPSSFNELALSSLERARSANGAVFDHFPSVGLLQDTGKEPAVTASGVTMVRAAMQAPWETSPMMAVIRMARKSRTKILSRTETIDVRSKTCFLGDPLALKVIQLLFKGTYDRFICLQAQFSIQPSCLGFVRRLPSGTQAIASPLRGAWDKYLVQGKPRSKT